MKSQTGSITVVQEGRFRLVTPDGRTLLFMLAPGAGLEVQDLLDLEREEADVRVDYDEPASLLAAVARRIHDTTDFRSSRT